MVFYPNLKIKTEDKKYVSSMSKSVVSKKMSFGPKCKILEKKLKSYLKVKNVILTTSGTSALMMAAIATGIKPGEKVLCSNAAWVAATNPFLIMGAKLIVVDTKKNSEIVDFKLLNEKIIKEKPKVVILVHLNGQPNYNKNFDKLKKKMKFFVIEDAAQAFLSYDEKKINCGTKNEIGCYSFSIAKPIHMIYGGFCVTNNKLIAQRLLAARNNGMYPRFEKSALATTIGLNLKPSDLHAAVGIENLKTAKQKRLALLDNYNAYKKHINNKKIHFLEIQGTNSVPNFAQVLVKNRLSFLNFCKKNNIGVTTGLRGISETGMIKEKNSKFKNSFYLSKHLVRIPFGTGYKKSEIIKISSILNKY